ncbi:DUF4350 domain-containing protein [Novosphingobium sp.]|uniref:DUF4350 domain-containing protein n=1 Tax=Novosphingobium sp. TaxID=1874826 RepID=UPI0038B7BBAF
MSGGPSPFARGTLIGIVLIGLLAFVALLYALGNQGGPLNNGGGHAGGRGLNGYAALAAMLEADGMEVQRIRSKQALAQPGLLVLTPPADADGSKIAQIVEARRRIGPTLVVIPKWLVLPVNRKNWFDPQRRKGWTRTAGTDAPEWKGFADNVTVSIGRAAEKGRWQSVDKSTGTGNGTGTQSGHLPAPATVETGSGKGLIPLVTTADGRMLAAYAEDAGVYPELDRWADMQGGDDTDLYPLVYVFEPDLLDNWGMADRATGLLAYRLIMASAMTRTQPVMFDLTLNGLGANRNLLTLAFEPPFLAATLCLLLALVAVVWRAFLPFGPRLIRAREIAAGKTALVGTSAALVRRAGRLHLIAAPYADASRERLVLALGLPRGRLRAQSETAIDAAQARRGIPGPRYSDLAAALRAARHPHDLARSARALQNLEKELVR